MVFGLAGDGVGGERIVAACVKGWVGDGGVVNGEGVEKGTMVDGDGIIGFRDDADGCAEGYGEGALALWGLEAVEGVSICGDGFGVSVGESDGGAAFSPVGNSDVEVERYGC